MAYSKPFNNNVQRGHSFAVSSVMYSQNHSSFTETKNGSYVFWGGAHEYHEWEFGIRFKTASYRDAELYVEAVSRVVDGLRGEAFVVAQEVGLEKLWHPGNNAMAAAATRAATGTGSQARPAMQSLRR